jgi:MFS family permease
MEELARQIHELVEIGRANLPSADLPPLLPTAIVMLLFGVGIGTLGAKLARWFSAVLFAVGGIAVGVAISRGYGIAPWTSALLGGFLFGSIGYVLFRLWVGVFAAAFLAVVAMTAFSSQEVMPHLSEFAHQQGIVAQAPSDAQSPAMTGEASPHGVVNWQHAEDYLHRFGDYLMTKEPNVRKYAAVYVLAAGVVGLLMGVFLCRFTLILFTSALGAVLIGSGVTMLGSALGIDVYQACQSRPEMTSLALAAFFIVSVILQAVLTRPEAKSAPATVKVIA